MSRVREKVKYTKITRFSLLPDEAAFALQFINADPSRLSANIREQFYIMITQPEKWQERSNLLRDFINEIVLKEKISLSTNGLEWVPAKGSSDLAAQILLIASLLHAANHEPRRLKLCSFRSEDNKIVSCGTIFWDESPNLIREICDNPDCAKERHRLTVAKLREIKRRNHKRGK